MLKTTEKRITIPPDQTDPMVYFRGTEKEIAAAENMRKRIIARWQFILNLPGFTALKFDRDYDFVILSKSAYKNVEWQITWFSKKDHFANMHSSFGGPEAVHSLDTLADALYRETYSKGAEVEVMIQQ